MGSDTNAFSVFGERIGSWNVPVVGEVEDRWSFGDAHRLGRQVVNTNKAIDKSTVKRRGASNDAAKRQHNDLRFLVTHSFHTIWSVGTATEYKIPPVIVDGRIGRIGLLRSDDFWR